MRIFLILLCFLTTLTDAQSNDCKKDFVGEIYCAPFGGMAIKTLDGVACSVGKCLIDNLGQIQCSNVVGGSVIKDATMTVKCVGKCVAPSKDLCVSFEEGK
jgi:hypothetical protein